MYRILALKNQHSHAILGQVKPFMFFFMRHNPGHVIGCHIQYSKMNVHSVETRSMAMLFICHTYIYIHTSKGKNGIKRFEKTNKQKAGCDERI